MRARTALALAWRAVVARRLLLAPPPAPSERRARAEALYAAFRPAFRHVPEVDAEALRRLVDAGGVVLVDVRTEAERRVSVVPGAVTPATLPPSDGRPVIATCTVGVRSAAWAAARPGVANLVGGLVAWTHAGGPLVGPDGTPTRRLHLHGLRWELQAPDHEAVR